jgi:hypothetical protein
MRTPSLVDNVEGPNLHSLPFRGCAKFAQLALVRIWAEEKRYLLHLSLFRQIFAGPDGGQWP